MADSSKIPGALQSLRSLHDELMSQSQTDSGLSEKGQKVLNLIQTSSVGDGGWDTFFQGLSSNMSDEIFAGIQSTLGIDDDLVQALNQYRKTSDLPPVTEYEASLAGERFGIERTREEYPKTAIASELVGAAIPGLAAATITGGASLPVTLGRAALIGTGAGGLAGFAHGEGGVENRLTDAAGGAAAGAVAAPLFNIGARVLGSGWKGLTSYGPETRAQIQANKQIDEMIRSDELTPELIGARLASTDKPLSMIDAGDNLTSMARGIISLPGSGKTRISKFLKGRDEEYFNRVTTDIQNAFGKRARLFDDLAALKQSQIRMGNKLYGKAFAKKIPVTKELNDLLSEPLSMQRAWKYADELVREERGKYRLPKLAFNQLGELVDSNGAVVKVLDTRFLHYIKMGIDRDLKFGKSMVTDRDLSVDMRIKDTRFDLLDYMDRHNPAYKKARDTWAGNEAVRNAMDDGKNLFKADVDELRDQLTRMSKNEREAFRIGVMQGLFDEVERVTETGNIAKNLLRSRKRKELIALSFDQNQTGQRNANRFINNLENEIDMKARSSWILHQTATAQTQNFIRSIREGAERSNRDISGLGDMVINTVREHSADLQNWQLERVGKLIADVLTETDDKKLISMLQARTPEKITRNLLMGIKEKPPWLLNILSSPSVAGYAAGTHAPDALRNVGLLGEYPGL